MKTRVCRACKVKLNIKNFAVKYGKNTSYRLTCHTCIAKRPPSKQPASKDILFANYDLLGLYVGASM